MKKLTITIIGIVLLLLSACNSDKLTVDVEKDLYVQKDKPTEFTIKVTDEDGPVEGLDIKATFNMTKMDHGTTETVLEEVGEGVYSTEVELSMAGEWEIVFVIDQDGKSIEKVIQYEVKEASGVATINGEWVTKEDVEFYRFINKLHIAINRVKDKSKYEGEELEDALAYWDSQEKLNEDQNQLLTQIIRLRSIALLGLEKGHKASSEEVKAEVENVRKQYEEVPVSKEMIKEFGEEKFWEKEQKQYELIVLSQKVQNDLITKVKKENPEVNEQEVMYLAQKLYEELLVSQVNSLEIEIF